MARMIPDYGPNKTQSLFTEPDLYWRLKNDLSDDFLVIHSTKWLASAAKEYDGREVVIGEIDFLIFHPDLGILSLEVKGGRVKYDGTRFVYVQNNYPIDPENQLGRGAHALARWIFGAGGPGVKIGKALVFPGSEFHGKPLPPDLVDMTIEGHPDLIIDKTDLNRIGNRVVDLMSYWKQVLGNPPLGPEKINKIIDLIAPIQDYSPSWNTRIQDDNRTWLVLTDEQSRLLQDLIEKKRMVVNGRPGTGKTLLAISLARQLSANGEKVLFLTYNVRLSQYLTRELSDVKIPVLTFHELCRKAARTLGQPIGNSQEWYSTESNRILADAVKLGKLPEYTVLIVDEGQAFHPEWFTNLCSWFADKRVTVFCDETQVFSYETSTHISELVRISGSDSAYLLTINVRSPKAVFDRLLQVFPSNYQQSSPRQFENDSLVELSDPLPKFTLIDVLQKLKEDDQVPTEAITLLFPNKFDPNDFSGYADLVGQMETIDRFRGLESPVIVVFAADRASDNELFSAYSRATSRCIVLFNLLELANEDIGEFEKAYLSSEQTDEVIRSAVKKLWDLILLPNLSIRYKRIISEFGNIGWCEDWGYWLSIGYSSEEKIISELWSLYIAGQSKYPIYEWHSKFPDRISRIPFPGVNTTQSEPSSFTLEYCINCGKWTRHQVLLNKATISHKCYDCMRSEMYIFPAEDANQIIKYEKLISLPSLDQSTESKLPLSLLALRIFLMLNNKDQSLLADILWGKGGTDRLPYYIGLIFTGIHLLRTEINKPVSLRTFREKYIQRFPQLASISSWNKDAALCLNFWKMKGWIEKVSTGEYRRIHLDDKPS